MTNIMEVHDLNKQYRGFSLNNVSLSLPEDCITGFIGINGAGKTTTIRCILELARKKSGIVTILGEDMAKSQTKIKDKIGVVLDEGFLYETLTMQQMKSLIAPAYSKWDNAEYSRLMRRFSLNPNKKIASLSRGMRMQFALVLALSHHAELLIMDEPTSGLDPLIRSQLLEIMREFMNRGGKGVFFSTHITSDLDKVADMLILINNGAIVFEEDKDYLFDAFRLVKGDKDQLNGDSRMLFTFIRETDYGFEGLTNNVAEVQNIMPKALYERPSVEDIMLAYVGGDTK